MTLWRRGPRGDMLVVEISTLVFSTFLNLTKLSGLIGVKCQEVLREIKSILKQNMSLYEESK